MKFFPFYFVIQFILILPYSYAGDTKCLNTFKPISLKYTTLLDLNTFKSIPLTEQEIIERVFSGEDIRLLDLNKIRENQTDLETVFPEFDIHIAYKALSSTRSLDMLKKEFDAKFEIATVEEFRTLSKKGIKPENIIFTHPDKDALEISETFKGGIRTFVSDSPEDIKLLSKHAPGAKVLIRILPNNEFTIDNTQGVENFDERFGVTFENAKKLILMAMSLKLKPAGIAFHVGTQTEYLKTWDNPIKQSASFFRDMKNNGINLTILDIGGGFPMIHKGVPPLSEFGKSIRKSLHKYFDKDIYPKKIIIEPGRFVSASAGITITRVINVKKNQSNLEDSVVTVSTGRYSGGIIHFGYKFSFYSVEKTENGNRFCRQFRRNNLVLGHIYGKACASIDRLSMMNKEIIPADLKSGDLMVTTGTGAYTGETATPNWCGKKSPTDIIFDSKKGTLIYEGKVGCRKK